MKQRFASNTLVVLATVLCLLAGNATAQTQYLTAGTKALQFQIQNDFQLDTFDGSTISIKKQKSSNRAYRLGLTVDADLSDREQWQSNSQGDTYGWEEDHNSQDLQLSVQKLFYTNPGNRSYAYFGLGPMGRLVRSHLDRTYTNSSGDNSVQEHLSRTWSAGIVGSLGVEWFAHRNISLLAEYNTTAAISWEKDRVESSSSTGSPFSSESDRTRYSIDNNGVRFGLAVYF